MAGSAVDGQVRVDSPAEEEAVVEDGPAGDDLMEFPAVELVAEVEPELTPEQRQIAELKDQLARLAGRKDIEPVVVDELAAPGDDKNILIHFLEDGLTALGKVWFRGQELEFEVGSQPYRDTFDRFGRSWLDLRHDEFAQVDRFGKVMFRSGPWPGKTYADGTFEPLKDLSGAGSVKAPSVEELAAAEKQRLRRAAPRLPSLTAN